MDWNNDGKLDLIAGNSHGTVFLYLNEGTAKAPKLAEGLPVKAGGKVITPERTIYKQVNDKYEVDKTVECSHPLVKSYSKLHMADWDGDGLKDLLVGQTKVILFYKNEGTAKAPKFKDPVALTFPEALPGRPSPYVVDWDRDGIPDLLLGSDACKVYFCRNIGTAKKPKLAAPKDLELSGPGFKDGYRCRLAVTDWNSDGKPDLLVGNFMKRANPTGKQKYGGNIWLFLGK